MKTVVALYDNLTDAHEAVDELVNAGFARNDVSLVAGDATGEYGAYLDEHDGEDMAEGAATGAVGGAVVGGLAGLLVGLGALAIPGVGPIIAAGPLAATLAGAGIGAATGGLLGALVEWGIPEAEAGYYAEGVRRGGTLVAARVQDNRVEEAVDILDDFNPVDIDRRADYWRSEEGWEGYDAESEPFTTAELDSYRTNVTEYDRDFDADMDMADEASLEIVEEELAVGKRRHERPVRVSTYIVETPVEEDVTLRQERVEIERRPVDRPATDADFEERHIELTEFEEEAVAEKRARVTEEIHLKKEADTRTETVRDTVRRTEVDIDEGNSNRRAMHGGTNSASWSDLETVFRQDFDANYASGAYGWNQYSPAYRYGYNLATDPAYADRDWAEIETDARTRWEQQNSGTWNDFSNAIRYGWEQVKDATGMGSFRAGVDDSDDEFAHRR
jgi:stress response protein YsnF